MKLRQALTGKLSADELKLLRASFDVVGDIAIIEVPLELKHKAKVIGETLLGLVKNINVVLEKQGGHVGKYRRQKMKTLAGENRKESVHKENGVRIKVNVETCYYSPRLSTERARIAKLVKPGEKVLVVGSGVGPYPLVIARHSKAKEVVGVEVNPSAHKYAKENIVLNQLQDRVTVIKGDASDFGRQKFDRVVIAMPNEGVQFAARVLKNVKPEGYLHVLDFAPEDDLKAPSRKLKEVAASKKRKIRILRTIKAGQHAVRSYRVCVDAKVI